MAWRKNGAGVVHGGPRSVAGRVQPDGVLSAYKVGSGLLANTPWTSTGLAGIMAVGTPTHYWDHSGPSPYSDTGTDGTVTLTRDGASGYTEQDPSAAFGRNGVSFTGAANVGYVSAANKVNATGVSMVALSIYEILSGAGAGNQYLILGRGAAYNYLLYPVSSTNVMWQSLAGTADSELWSGVNAQTDPNAAMGVCDRIGDSWKGYSRKGNSAGQVINSTIANNTFGFAVGGSSSWSVLAPKARIMATAVWVDTAADGEDWATGYANLKSYFGW